MSYLVLNYLVDSWSVIHLFFFFCLFNRNYFLFRDLKSVLVYSIFLGYWWELLEIFIEMMGSFRYTEPNLNRYVFDILFDISGAIIGFIYGRYLENILNKKQNIALSKNPNGR